MSTQAEVWKVAAADTQEAVAAALAAVEGLAKAAKLAATIPISLRAVGGAPALRKSKVRLSRLAKVCDVGKFLCQRMGAPVNIFINGFSPQPDQSIAELSDLFSSPGEAAEPLAITYSFKETWG